MVQWISGDLEYVEHEFIKSARKKFYAKIWFKDKQTKRRIAVYDFSGLESAAQTFEHFQDAKWWISGVVNAVGEKYFLVLQRFALMDKGKKIYPYRMTEGVAEVELVA
jgi:hypothetical protein